MPSKLRNTPGVSRGSDLWMIEPAKIFIKPGFNPRQDLNVDDLKDYIRANGVRTLPPLRVSFKNDRIELITGHRRLKAIIELIEEGLPIKSIQCQLEATIPEDELLVIAIAENQGEPLTPIEEAFAYKRLVNFNWTVEQIAQKIGKSTGHTYSRLKLAEAESEVKQAIQDGFVTMTDAVKVIKEASQTGENQTVLLKKRQATKVDKRTKAIKSLPIEERVWNILCPIVIKYGAELVYSVLETHAITVDVED